MDTRNYHAHIRIRKCIENNQSGSGCVPVQQTAMRYHKIGLVDKRRLIMYISWNIADQSRMTNKSNKQSINHKEITYVGPPPKPDHFAWINITDSIILDLWKIHSCLYKIKRDRKLLENQSGIKNVWENWIFEIYMKIGVLGISWKLEF